jgi:asparagine synthase (glutamine-hydrolysing)
MCGIAGFVGFGNNYSLAQKANEIQKHRGPDHQGLWSDERIALSHQRLSIIDLSEEANQPFEKYNFVIVFNGEIYNYKELRLELDKSNRINYRTTSDTEVVLEYYRRYGEKCLNYFIGMFAFAIYDKTSKSLFLARDHFGIKPLFYHHSATKFSFSSELKTLTELKIFPKDLNVKQLVASLNYVWVPGNESMFKNFYKLPPAHYLILDSNNSIFLKRYWQINEGNISNASEENLIEEFDTIINNSIKRHLVADVPISSFLSGGLDSSLIAALTNKYISPLTTFTIGTSHSDKQIEKMTSDEFYAKKIAKKDGFLYNEIILESNIIKDLPFIVNALDEPIGDPAALNTYIMCKAAKDKGLKVILSGMGADEILFGYRRQKATLYAERYKNLPRVIKYPLKMLVNNLPVKYGKKGMRFNRWSKKFLMFAESPSSEAYRLSYSYYLPNQIQNLFNFDVSTEINLIIEEHSDLFNSGYNDIINKMCNTDITMFMNGLNLTYSDRASMAASVELRVPYIDKEVVEFAMSIPGKYKYKHGQSKYILKKVAEKYLPKDIVYRPKASFGAPIRSWISNDLSGMVDDLLSETSIKHRGLFNYNQIKDIIQVDKNGKEDKAYQIYQLLTLELWFRNFVD